MKKLLLGGVAALVLASCGSDKTEEITAALAQMQLEDQDAEIKGKKDEVILKNVIINPARWDEDSYTESEADAFDDVEEGDDEMDADEPVLVAEEMIFNGLRLQDDGSSVFKKVTLNSVKLDNLPEDENVDAKVGNITLDEPTPELAAWVTGLLGQGEMTEVPEMDDFQFKAFGISEISFGGGDEYSSGEFKLGSFVVEDFYDYKAGVAKIEGMTFDFTDGWSEESFTFSLEEMGFTGLDLKLIKAFEEEDDYGIASSLMDIVMEDPMDPGLDSFNLKALNFDGGGLTMDLPSMSYTVERNSDGVPTRMVMPEFTLTVTADEEGSIGSELAPVMAMLGFDEIVLSVASEFTYDPETDIGNYKQTYIAVDDAFEFNLTGKLGGIQDMSDAMKDMDAEAYMMGEDDPMEMMMALYGPLEIHDLKIAITDDGIIDKGFALAAAEQGVDPKELRMQIAGMVSAVPVLGADSGVDMALMTEVSSAASDFIKQGGTLTISLDPEDPILVSDLMADPLSISKSSLGLTAETK